MQEYLTPQISRGYPLPPRAGRLGAWRALLLFCSLLTSLACSAADPGAALLVFTKEGCNYCERLLRDQIAPLKLNADLAWLRIVEVPMAGEESIALPDGRRASGRALATAYQVKLAPTVVFLDRQGAVAAKALVGYTSPDFYGAFIDQRIEQLAATPGAKGLAPGNK